MQHFLFMLKWALWILGCYLAGRLLVFGIEKLFGLPFYEWQKDAIGILCYFVVAYFFGDDIFMKKK